MAVAPDPLMPDRRATWVGLRTLRRRPTVVGRTNGGEPVFAINSVRLVLQGDATYFNRFDTCSRCGGDVPGALVTTPAQLSHPSHRVISSKCVRSATLGSARVGSEEAAEPLADVLLTAEPQGTSVNGSIDERAAEIGLRTLEEEPRDAGRLNDGQPIYEVRSVRLVLEPEGSCFKRLVECAQCGRGGSGGAVRTPADLDRPTESAICDACAKAAASAEVPEAIPADVGAEELIVAEAVTEPGPTSVEADLQAIRARIAELADLQRSESLERRRADDLTRTVFQKRVLERLAEVRADTMASAEAGRDRIVELEDDRRHRADAMAAADAARQEELAAIHEARRTTSAQLQALARAQSELDERLCDMADRLEARPTGDGVAETVRRQIEHASAGIVEATDARLAAELGTVRSEIAFDHGQLEERMASAPEVAAEMAAAQQRDFEARLAAAVRQELSTIAGSVSELWTGHAEFEGRFAALERKAGEEERRAHVLVVSTDAAAGRLQALEAKVQALVTRLTRLLGTQSGERHPEPRVSRPMHVAAEANASAGRSVLDSLEAQLKEAELRLARSRSGHRGG